MNDKEQKNNLPWYLHMLGRVKKRFAVAVIVFFGTGLLLAFPNPVTHECMPTLRYQTGVIDHTGYNYERAFCDEGFQPTLKYGLEGIYKSSTASIFLFPFAVGLLFISFLILAQKNRK